MINVYIISGFLGAGKTSFIKKLLSEKKFKKVMLLENEFGEVGVDGAFFDSALNVKEINNGCICCSLKGDFKSALEEIEDMDVSDLIIEPSGVGKLSDILNVVKDDDDFRVVSHICIVDVKTCKKYHKNFKEYFDDQVKAANAIVLSHVDVAGDKIEEAKEIVREINDDVTIIDKAVEFYTIDELMDLIVAGNMEFEPKEEEHCCCCCGHHDHEHEHHHHDHGHDEEAEHEHHHEHHHHDGFESEDEDELFKNQIVRTDYVFTKEELELILNNVDEDIIRIKGYVNTKEGTMYLNYVLNEYHLYLGEKRDNTLVSIIGTSIDKNKYKEAFHG